MHVSQPRRLGRKSKAVFSYVYVILPVTAVPPAEAIRTSLAPFQRGTEKELGRDMVAFRDETNVVEDLYAAELEFSRSEGGGLQILGLQIGGVDCGYLDTDAIREEMARRSVDRWRVRLADLAPNLDAFFDRFVRTLERHPQTGRFGRWLNPLGRWDWWDLGGRFDGFISGDTASRPRPDQGRISSGANTGRLLIGNVRELLTDPGDDESASAVPDANIELVSTLLDHAKNGSRHAFPGALLLPPGPLEDRLGWIRTWNGVEPVEAVQALGLPSDATWEEVVIAAYERFADHWAAGVAYHL